MNNQDVNIRGNRLIEDVHTFLHTCGNPGSGENFFESLARYLSQILDMEYVCIDKLEGDCLTAQTVAIYNESRFEPNVSYALRQTPCGDVVGKTVCCFPENVCALFPYDKALQELNAESYIGTTLWSFDGHPLGLIAVIGQKPLADITFAENVLKIVAIRAAGELERKKAEETLELTRQSYLDIINTISEAIYIIDKSGTFISVNKGAERMYHSDLHYLVGKTPADVAAPGLNDMEKIQRQMDSVFLTGVSESFEFWGIRKNGEVFPKEVIVNKGRYFGDDVLVATARDISERKQAENIFREIIDKNPMAIQILNMDGYTIQTNSAHTKVFGAEIPAEYSIFNDNQLLDQGFGELFERIKNGEVVYFPDSYFNVHDVDPAFPDDLAWIRAIGFTLNNSNGTPEKIVMIQENITDRKHAEAMFQDIIDKNPMSIQIVDRDGCTISANPAFIKLFSILPPPGFSIFADLQTRNPELEELLLLAKSGNVVNLPDLYYNPKDLSPEYPDVPLWLRALIFPLNDLTGKPERFVLMHENITEHKLALQELIKSKNQAEESDRLKSAFLANMSHEIRTPMNGILGFAELLKEPDLSGEQQQEYIKIIEKSGARMLNIINDIIDISKIEAGLMKVDIRDSNINDQIEYLYTFFKPEVEAKGMQLIVKTPLPAKEVILKTDQEKVFAILTNLIKNAIKYTREGSIEFGYLTDGTHPDNDHVLQFYVKDTGMGIPDERKDAIFERFIQVDISDKMARQGAGLGLSITKAFVEMLGGKLWVESTKGVGSTFYFTLPYNSLS